MEKRTINIFESTNILAKKFAEILLHETIKLPANRNFSIALSGGSTPKKIFEYLSKYYADKIPWNKIDFYWGDERCVPPDDPQSNYLMTRLFLFDHISVKNKNIHRIKGESFPEKEAERYSKLFNKNLTFQNNLPQFNMILLGLGDDGHTASIFPHQLELFNSDRYCVTANHPLTGQKRISLSGNVINNAQKVIFLVTGEKKASIVKKILDNSSISTQFPASLVNPLYGELVWMLDKSAAKLLNN